MIHWNQVSSYLPGFVSADFGCFIWACTEIRKWWTQRQDADIKCWIVIMYFVNICTFDTTNMYVRYMYFFILYIYLYINKNMLYASIQALKINSRTNYVTWCGLMCFDLPDVIWCGLVFVLLCFDTFHQVALIHSASNGCAKWLWLKQ